MSVSVGGMWQVTQSLPGLRFSRSGRSSLHASPGWQLWQVRLYPARRSAGSAGAACEAWQVEQVSASDRW
jgi:hypothetical protein